jgi:large subunit ribosomal protein L23
MALFKKKEAQETEAAPTGQKQSISSSSLHHILRRPRITEKATDVSARGVYVFEVAPEANKQSIAEAIKKFYNVVPTKIRIVPLQYKRIASRFRGKFGVTGGGKKAYVYLKEGDRIEIV